MNEFMKAVQNRRSIYGISNEEVLSIETIKELIEAAVNHVPTAFNAQTGRVILLTGDSHRKLWNIALNQLKAVTPPDNFPSTQAKMDSFSAGYGTILYFEEQKTITALQNKFPLYSENFPKWSEQSSGMLQFALWTALEQEGLGVTLQHYNPLIDEEVSKTFHVPDSWRLIAQMPFGKPLAPAGDKTFLPIESRVKIFN